MTKKATVIGLSLLAVAFLLSSAVPAAADPATCSWEWGGVPEDPPMPCDEPTAPAEVVYPDEYVVPVDVEGLPLVDPLPVAEVSPIDPSFTADVEVEAGLTDDQETSIVWALALLLFFVAAGLVLNIGRTIKGR